MSVGSYGGKRVHTCPHFLPYFSKHNAARKKIVDGRKTFKIRSGIRHDVSKKHTEGFLMVSLLGDAMLIFVHTCPHFLQGEGVDKCGHVWLPCDLADTMLAN